MNKYCNINGIKNKQYHYIQPKNVFLLLFHVEGHQRPQISTKCKQRTVISNHSPCCPLQMSVYRSMAPIHYHATYLFLGRCRHLVSSTIPSKLGFPLEHLTSDRTLALASHLLQVLQARTVGGTRSVGTLHHSNQEIISYPLKKTSKNIPQRIQHPLKTVWEKPWGTS
jgi:hypothetical protein